MNKISNIALILTLMLVMAACSDEENETSGAPYLTFGAAGGGNSAVALSLINSDALTQTFPIKSNGSWKIVAQESSPWVTVSPDHGTGDGLLTFNVEQNFVIADRTAKFVCLLNDREQRSIYVSQKAFSPKMEITSDLEMIPTGGGTITLNIATDVAWQYSTTANWLTEVEKTESTLTLRAAENTTPATRQAILTFSYPDYVGEAQYVVAQQDALSAYEMYQCSKTGWSVLEVSDQTASDGGGKDRIIDGNYATDQYWHSQWGPDAPCPHWAVIDMKDQVWVSRITTQRRNNGDTKTLQYFVGDNPDPNAGSWVKVAEGAYASTTANHTLALDVKTEDLRRGRYLKLVLPDSNRNPFTAICETDVFGLRLK